MKALALKSLAGLLNLLVMMGLAIFLPAGTTHYLQAWIYLGAFFLGVLIITVYIFRNDQSLLQSRLKVGTTAEKRPAQKVIQTIAAIGFIGMYIVSGFDHRYGWSAVPEWLWAVSDIMILVSMILLFVIFKKNTYLSATVEVQAKQTVISDGPYGIVRHPMYSAALLLFIFSPLALGSFWGVAAFPLMIIVLAARLLDEEKALGQELHGYEEYRQKVRYRLIPFVW